MTFMGAVNFSGGLNQVVDDAERLKGRVGKYGCLDKLPFQKLNHAPRKTSKLFSARSYHCSIEDFY